MIREYVGNRLRAEFSSIIGYARTDLSHFIDVFKLTPPAMFRNRPELDNWIKSNNLSYELIKGSNEKIIRVHGTFYQNGEPVPYSQLWAKASYKGYRKPWSGYHSAADNVSSKLLKKMHADHVINKERIFAKHAGAWVMLFPVPDGSNSPFGSLIEKSLPYLTEADVDSHGYPIDGLVGFKIYSMEYPRTEIELKEQLNAIKGQVPAWFFQEIESAIRSKWVLKSI